MQNSETEEKTEVGSNNKLRVILTAITALVVVPGLIALGTVVWQDRKIYVISLLIILASMLPFALPMPMTPLTA